MPLLRDIVHSTVLPTPVTTRNRCHMQGMWSCVQELSDAYMCPRRSLGAGHDESFMPHDDINRDTSPQGEAPPLTIGEVIRAAARSRLPSDDETQKINNNHSMKFQCRSLNSIHFLTMKLHCEILIYFRSPKLKYHCANWCMTYRVSKSEKLLKNKNKIPLSEGPSCC